jgi:hypothetical protein
MSEQYSGYTNYETWAIGLLIDNNMETQAYWHEQASECFESSLPEEQFSRSEVAAIALSHKLKEESENDTEHIQTFVKKRIPENLYLWKETPNVSYRGLDWVETIAKLTADYANRSLSKVNWLEIANELVGGVYKVFSY